MPLITLCKVIIHYNATGTSIQILNHTAG